MSDGTPRLIRQGCRTANKEGRGHGEGLPVLGCRSAGAGAARSGGVPGAREGASGSDGADGSAGGGAADGGGVPGAGAGGGRGDGPAASGADAGASACGGVASGPAGSPSFPSCVPWCSCSHLTWQQGGASAQPSASETQQNGRGQLRSVVDTTGTGDQNDTCFQLRNTSRCCC